MLGMGRPLDPGNPVGMELMSVDVIDVKLTGVGEGEAFTLYHLLFINSILLALFDNRWLSCKILQGLLVYGL